MLVGVSYLGRLFVLLTVVLPGLARAVEGNGHHEELFEQFKVVLDVGASGAVAPDWFVSGTKVEVTLAAAAYRRGAGPNPAHDAIRLKAARLKIGGTQVDHAPRPTSGPPGGPPGGGLPPGGLPGGGGTDAVIVDEEWIGIPLDLAPLHSRFASTHFADGGTVAIVYETDWELMRNGVPDPTLKRIDVTLNATPYNRVLA